MTLNYIIKNCPTTWAGQLSNFWEILLFFPPHTFVRLSVLVHINKLSSVGVTFHPLFGFRIENLRTFLNSTVAVTVSDNSIFCHGFKFLAHKLFNTKALMYCPRNKFGSNINISTFTIENIIPPGKIHFNLPKLYSTGFGFFI